MTDITVNPYQPSANVYLATRRHKLCCPHGECNEQGIQRLHPNITMSFLDNIPIKGCPKPDKDETLDGEGCKHFVTEHITKFEKVLQRLEDVHLTFSCELEFGQSKILMVGHLCKAYGQKPSSSKVDTI